MGVENSPMSSFHFYIIIVTIIHHGQKIVDNQSSISTCPDHLFPQPTYFTNYQFTPSFSLFHTSFYVDRD